MPKKKKKAKTKRKVSKKRRVKSKKRNTQKRKVPKKVRVKIKKMMNRQPKNLFLKLNQNGSKVVLQINLNTKINIMNLLKIIIIFGKKKVKELLGLNLTKKLKI